MGELAVAELEEDVATFEGIALVGGDPRRAGAFHPPENVGLAVVGVEEAGPFGEGHVGHDREDLVDVAAQFGLVGDDGRPECAIVPDEIGAREGDEPVGVVAVPLLHPAVGEVVEERPVLHVHP